jgi:hypothetical protein
MVKNAKIRYTTWKYWHVPFLHALSMAVIASYDMYSECCEGGLDPDWKVDEKDRLSFQDYRLQLSEQMLMYDPKKQVYQGDGAFRKVTKLGKRKKGGVTYWKGEKGGVSIENFKIAKSSTRHSPSQLCGPLDDFERHVESIARKPHVGECAVCGGTTYWFCGLCNKRVCLKTGAKGCHIDLHNDSMFGLTKCDFRELMGGDPGKWSAANVMAKRRNKTWVDKLRAKWMKEDQVD